MAITRREAIIGSAGAVAGVAAAAVSYPVAKRLLGGTATEAALTMHYSGLLGLVRTKKPTPGQMVDFGPMYGLLVDSKYVKDQGQANISEHVPLLRVRTLLVKNAEDFAKYVNRHFIEIPLKGQIVNVKLEGVSTAGKSVYATIRADRPDLGTCPKGDEWNEVTWLPNMELIIKTGAKPVKKSYLTDKNLSGTPVASRIEIGGGTLICGPPSLPGVSKTKAHFTESSYHHITTDTVRHVSPSARSVSIEFLKFGGAEEVKEMVLDVSYGVLEADIENQRPMPGTHDPDHHFTAYYSLLDSYANDKHVPGDGDECVYVGYEPDWPLYCPPPFMS